MRNPFRRTLSLSRETLRRLDVRQLRHARGGAETGTEDTMMCPPSWDTRCDGGSTDCATDGCTEATSDCAIKSLNGTRCK